MAHIINASPALPAPCFNNCAIPCMADATAISTSFVGLLEDPASHDYIAEQYRLPTCYLEALHNCLGITR